MIFIHGSLTKDIAYCFRAVRAMNETLKQNRLLREREEDRSFAHSPNDNISDLQKNVCLSHSCERVLSFTLCSLIFSINSIYSDVLYILLIG